MKEIKKETRGSKKKMFGKLLEEFGCIDEYEYDRSNYSRINIWYRRLQKNYLHYCTLKGMDTDSIKKNVFLAYLLSIYLYIETDMHEDKTVTSASFSRFINNCIRYCTQPQKKQDFICTYYKWTIPSGDMSFFLHSFAETSIVSKKINDAFSFKQTDVQRTSIEKLLNATEQSPYEVFDKLAELFNMPLP